MKKGIIFDLDGVLVDSMPTHVRAWREAFVEVAGISVTGREIYLLEGMRGIELVTKILVQRGISDDSLAKAVHEEKSKIFRSIRRSYPFEGVNRIISNIKCAKAVVSGSTRRDVETMLEEAFGIGRFAEVIAADDIRKGKPDPSAFLEALKRMGRQPSEAVVVENAPLGAKAAANAGIECFVVLNNTPLERADFDNAVSSERIFESIGTLGGMLVGMCR